MGRLRHRGSSAGVAGRVRLSETIAAEALESNANLDVAEEERRIAGGGVFPE